MSEELLAKKGDQKKAIAAPSAKDTAPQDSLFLNSVKLTDQKKNHSQRKPVPKDSILYDSVIPAHRNILIKEVSGIKIEVEETAKKLCNEKVLDRCIGIISEANLFLDENEKIALISLHLVGQGGRASDRPPAVTIYGLEKLLAYKDNLELLLWHEAAHHIETQWKEKNFSAWKQLFDMFRKMRTSPFFDVPSEKYGGSNALFLVFDESTYNSRSRGHPQDNVAELFTSASAVLRFFPDEFLKNVFSMNEQDRKICIDIAKIVVQTYLNNSKCPKDLFNPELLRAVGF